MEGHIDHFYLVYIDDIDTNHQLVGIYLRIEDASNRVNMMINEYIQSENLLNPIVQITINEPEYNRIDIFTDNHHFLIGFEIRRFNN